MPFDFSPAEIPDVVVIQPRLQRDRRGFFMEFYKRSDFAAHGIAEIFAQSNHSRSPRGVLRGLHYQKRPKAQAKLVRVVMGEVFDVAVDLRRGSPTFGAWVGMSLSADNQKMIYIPQGFAHGFCVVSEEAEVMYMTTEEYSPSHEAGVIWNDPELAIRWPVAAPELADRDRGWPKLRDADHNFEYIRGAAAPMA